MDEFGESAKERLVGKYQDHHGVEGPVITPPPPASNLSIDSPDVSEEIRPLLPYGVGIDCHSKFIQVCCLVQTGASVLRYEREFKTTWDDLRAAKAWALEKCEIADSTLEESNLRYCIESTGTYHQPVLLAWRGKPAVVNPMLAGATRRKSDVLDARALAQQNLMGLWQASFIPEMQSEILRILVNMRYEAGRNSTRMTNRINNNVLRFGHTLGREQKMADMKARAIIEDLCHGRVPLHTCICPDGIPEAAREFFLDSYEYFDVWKAVKAKYHKKCLEFIRTNTWPIAEGRADGKKLLECLSSVPGVGEVSAMTWLSVVCDPRRFQHPGQVAAFCGADPSLKVSAGKVTSHTKRKGNARLHHALKNVAASLVRLHNEPLGMWAFNIFRRNAKGGWAKAINALSRRLAICMWQVHKRCVDFSYDQYRFYEVIEVVDVKVEDMELGSRYTKLLMDAGLFRSTEIAAAFMTSLPQRKGIGAGCLSKVKVWLETNRVKRNPEQAPQELQGRSQKRQTAEEFLNGSKDSSSAVSSVDAVAKLSPQKTGSRRRSSSRTASTAVDSNSTLTNSSPSKSGRSAKKSKSR